MSIRGVETIFETTALWAIVAASSKTGGNYGMIDYRTLLQKSKTTRWAVFLHRFTSCYYSQKPDCFFVEIPFVLWLYFWIRIFYNHIMSNGALCVLPGKHHETGVFHKAEDNLVRLAGWADHFTIGLSMFIETERERRREQYIKPLKEIQ